MSILLEDLVEEWKRDPEYIDVAAECWEPNQPQIETCPHGCNLAVYEDTPTKIVYLRFILHINLNS